MHGEMGANESFEIDRDGDRTACAALKPPFDH
jgi:hypothetical protein